MSETLTLPVFRCRCCLHKAEVVRQPVSTQTRNGVTLTTGGQLLVTCKTPGCAHSYLTIDSRDTAPLATNYVESGC